MRDVIFVVGMGRSGSSALTRVLSLCGAALPLAVLPPNFGNPTGYWEPALALEINDRFLRAYESSWYDTSLRLQLGRVATGESAALVAQAAAMLADSFESSGPIVVKEPRISGLLPYWIEAARKAGLRPAIVHLFRNPDDVAASLARRDDLAAEQSRALWLKYNLVAERDGRGFARAFISYEDLMTDWERVVGRCAEDLRVDLVISDDARTAVAGFLSPELRHHTTPDERQVSDDESRLLLRTYRLLNAAKHKRPASSAFDSLLVEYGRTSG
ncbi:MAG: hypothetical protein JWO85_131 [Candidatus Eremiobacteraeota bacterium]|nr:hypothetical protein [Candidatus Eremiobacteraeota bacterium]